MVEGRFADVVAVGVVEREGVLVTVGDGCSLVPEDEGVLVPVGCSLVPEDEGVLVVSGLSQPTWKAPGHLPSSF